MLVAPFSNGSSEASFVEACVEIGGGGNMKYLHDRIKLDDAFNLLDSNAQEAWGLCDGGSDGHGWRLIGWR